MPEAIVRVWFEDRSFQDMPESQVSPYLLMTEVETIEWLWPRSGRARPEELS